MEKYNKALDQKRKVLFWDMRLYGSVLKNDNLFILYPLLFLILVQEITNKYCAVS